MNFAWLGNRLWEAECISPWFPISFALTLEHSESHIKNLSLEGLIGERRLWGNNDLQNSTLLQAAKSHLTPHPQIDWLLSYTPHTTFLSGLPKPLWTIPPPLKKLWGNKLRTRLWFKEVGLPTLPSYEVEVSKGCSSDNCTMVVQELGKSCGAGTYIGAPKTLFRYLSSLNVRKVLVSPFEEGVIINGHVGVFSIDHVEIPWPSVQLVEFAREKDHSLPLYAGNDYGAYQALPKATRQKIENALSTLGHYAAQMGYCGILGADIIYNPTDEAIYLLEVNARMQGSTGLLMKIESAAGMTPTVIRLFSKMLGKRNSSKEYSAELPKSSAIPIAQYLVRKDLDIGIHFDNKPIFIYGSTDRQKVAKYGVIERRVFKQSLAKNMLTK